MVAVSRLNCTKHKLVVTLRYLYSMNDISDKVKRAFSRKRRHDIETSKGSSRKISKDHTTEEHGETDTAMISENPMPVVDEVDSNGSSSDNEKAPYDDEHFAGMEEKMDNEEDDMYFNEEDDMYFHYNDNTYGTYVQTDERLVMLLLFLIPIFLTSRRTTNRGNRSFNCK